MSECNRFTTTGKWLSTRPFKEAKVRRLKQMQTFIKERRRFLVHNKHTEIPTSAGKQVTLTELLSRKRTQDTKRRNKSVAQKQDEDVTHSTDNSNTDAIFGVEDKSSVQNDIRIHSQQYTHNQEYIETAEERVHLPELRAESNALCKIQGEQSVRQELHANTEANADERAEHVSSVPESEIINPLPAAENIGSKSVCEPSSESREKQKDIANRGSLLAADKMENIENRHFVDDNSSLSQSYSFDVDECHSEENEALEHLIENVQTPFTLTFTDL